MSNNTDCLFCKITDRSIPADIVAESERTLAFRDIDPQAPTHILVIPKSHYPDVAALSRDDPTVLTEMVNEAAAIAQSEGTEAYRLVFNTGEQAGQSVFHVHVHVLGGRRMHWPPG